MTHFNVHDDIIPLNIPKTIWKNLIFELRKRGNGKRESGAFLLGNPQERIITNFCCYDDFDPSALESGMIKFNSNGFIPLLTFCEKNQLVVYADVHTHPYKWTQQSELDRTNPMVAVPGHIALIVPCFAKKNARTLAGVGIHEYIKNYRWNQWAVNSGKIKLI